MMKNAHISHTHFLPVLFPTSHTFLIDRSFELPETGEDGFMIYYDGFDDLIDMSLARYWILSIWNMHQSWSKANGQVVRIHHILITVLRQAANTSNPQIHQQLLTQEGLLYRQKAALQVD